MKIVGVFSLILLTFVFAGNLIYPESVSLVELQKKEAKRRKKTIKSKYVLTDSSIIYLSAGKKRVSFIKTDESVSEIGKSKKKSKLKKPLIDPKKTEKYWKQRMKALDERILKLKEQISKTQLSLNKVQTDYLNLSIPSQISNAKAKLTQLTGKLSELKTGLASAELQKENLHEEARKAGAPPGWLR